MFGKSGSSAASLGRFASQVFSSASLRYPVPRYSPFASPVMSSPSRPYRCCYRHPRESENQERRGQPPPESTSWAAQLTWARQPRGRQDITRVALGELPEPPSRRLFPLFYLVEIRRQQLLNRKHAPADGCRCPRNYTANMAIVCLSRSQVVEIGVDAERVLA